jgi:predicted CopG family antitoxin
MDLELLEQAVLNQIEADLNDGDFESFSEMMEQLLKDEKNRLILFNYLSDTAQKNLEEEKTVSRY